MIRTESLSVHYGSKTVVRDVSIVVRTGTITAIVGPSGSGKSSFLGALNRMTDLIPGGRITGKVEVACCDASAAVHDPVQLRRCVGMIFQTPNPFPMSIARNIKLALREHRTCKRDELDGVMERVLREVGLWEEVKDRLDSPARELSGGQQQRLCMARALALEPSILLMDEPCSALDPVAGRVVEDLILRLRGKHTIVVVTHNLAQAKRIADDVAVFWLRDGVGAVIEQGPAQRVFEESSDPVAAAYLRDHGPFG